MIIIAESRTMTRGCSPSSRPSPLKKDYSLAREILSRWFRRLILTAVEVRISRLVRRIMTRPKQLLCIVLDDAVPNEEQQH
jgi:hypothetical protein